MITVYNSITSNQSKLDAKAFFASLISSHQEIFRKFSRDFQEILFF